MRTLLLIGLFLAGACVMLLGCKAGWDDGCEAKSAETRESDASVECSYPFVGPPCQLTMPACEVVTSTADDPLPLFGEKRK